MKVVLSPQLKAAAPLGLTLAAVIVGVKLLVLPSAVRLQARRAELQALDAQVLQAREMQTQQAPQRALWEQAKPRYDAAIDRVGGGQSIAKILDTLDAQAKERGLELVATQPKRQGDAAGLAWGPGLSMRELPLSLQLHGHYKQLGEFLAWMPQAPFVSAVRKLTISKQTSGGLLAELELAVYLREEPKS